MASRLKSRTAHPPGSFQFLQPETGQTKAFVGSFDFVVAQVMTLRRGNRFLAEKHGWATDRAGVEFDVEMYNVARCEKHRWFNFLITDAAPPEPPVRDIPDGGHSKKNALESAVGAGRSVVAGVRTLLDWVGSGGKPVAPEVATARAATCLHCPRNDGGDWRKIFTEVVANKIRSQLEIKHQMKLRTPHDEGLTVCSACLCPLPLKVWAPLDHILAHQPTEVEQALDPGCWILKEKKGE